MVNLADRLLLWPQRGPEPAHGAARAVLTHGGRPLEIWKARSRPHEVPRAFVVQFVGNADRPERWIAAEAKSYDASTVDSVANAARATAPAIFVSSERDTLVPPSIQ